MRIESEEYKTATSKLLLFELESAIDKIFFHLDTEEQHILLRYVPEVDIDSLEDSWNKLALTTKILFFETYKDSGKKENKKSNSEKFNEEIIVLLLKSNLDLKSINNHLKNND